MVIQWVNWNIQFQKGTQSKIEWFLKGYSMIIFDRTFSCIDGFGIRDPCCWLSHGRDSGYGLIAAFDEHIREVPIVLRLGQV